MTRFLAVLTVRNEAAFLLEWLAHHQAVGFTDFLVFSNDCDDGTDLLLDQLQTHGQLTHIRNAGPHEGGVQWSALKQADKHPLVKQADWIMTLDVDEFVNIHTGDHTLSALVDALPEASAITLTWRLFGNNGVERFHDEPITTQFTAAAPRIMNWPWRASMFKTLYRNDGTYRKLGVHRPRSPDQSRVDQARWFDCCGRELGERFKRQQIFSPFGRENYQLAQLNHYPLGAMESYLVKRDRGRAVHDADQLGMSYWVERNWNIEQDTSISTLAAQSSAARTKLHSLSGLTELHQNGADWRRAKFDSLMRQEPYRALFGRLLMTPSSAPVSHEAARILYQYAQRAAPKQD
ncbi:MAG: glycosyltransferase family 2 protein [Marinosulfonomonas sp.]